jgi:hydrogenase-4 membrane subunit HyfE
MIWSPIIIYSTIGALVIVILYDFCRYLIHTEVYQRNNLWIYEHIYKMISAFVALLSAFSGTVLTQYQPHSQYIPSALGLCLIFGFMIYTAKYGLKG